jgi:hypothetical protein
MAGSMIFLSTLDKQDFLGWLSLKRKTGLTILYTCFLRGEKKRGLPAFSFHSHFLLDFTSNAATLVGRHIELYFPSTGKRRARFPGNLCKKTCGFRSEFQCLFTFKRGWSKPK